jgi:hypothetical protein
MYRAAATGYLPAKRHQQIGFDVRRLGNSFTAVPEVDEYLLDTIFHKRIVFNKLEPVMEQRFEIAMHKLSQSLIITLHQLLPEPDIP